MKKYISLIILICIIVGLIIWVYFDKPKKDTLEITTPEQVQQVKVDLIAKQLADKYQANINWDKDSNYTLQLQEKLINGKPTLFKGNIDDIFTRDNKFYIKLSPSYFFGSDNSDVNYSLELNCDKKIIDEIKSHNLDPLNLYGPSNNYLIVANVTSINKPVFTLNGSVLSEDEVEIDNIASDIFIIKATCVDATYVGKIN